MWAICVFSSETRDLHDLRPRDETLQRYRTKRRDPRNRTMRRGLQSPARALACLGLLVTATGQAGAGAASSDWVEGHNSRARLVAGNGIAAVELQMPEGWKTYWRTPGDAGGVPPSF